MEAQQSAQVQRVRQKIAALTLAVSCFPFLAFSGLIFFDNHLLSTWSLSIIHYPRGLRSKKARAVTGRRCPHSGEGEDFLTRQPGFWSKWESCSPRHTCDMPCGQKSQLPCKKMTFCPKISKFLGQKVHFLP